MRFLDYLDLSLSSVILNKARSFLSILGIVIGIAAIITVITIGQGGQKMLIQEMEKFGGRRVSLRQSTKHVNLKRTFKPSKLTKQDLQSLEKYCTHIELFSPGLKGQGHARYNGVNRIANLYGITETYKDFNNYKMLAGRFFTKNEITSQQKVTVIGETFYDEVFHGSDAIGKIIDVNNQKYTVIGIVKKDGAFADSYYLDMFDFVLIPITLLQQQQGHDKLRNINMLVKSIDEMESAKEEIFKILKKRHGPEADKHFAFKELRSTIDTVNKVLNIASMVIALIASISLVVGGIGIMNVLLIAVLERTREIGIQKALGATKQDILYLFLSESSVIGVFGGSFGIILGSLLCILTSYFTGIPIHINLSTVLFAVLFSLAIGFFFGIFPAYKASKMDPVEALRYE